MAKQKLTPAQYALVGGITAATALIGGRLIGLREMFASGEPFNIGLGIIFILGVGVFVGLGLRVFFEKTGK